MSLCANAAEAVAIIKTIVIQKIEIAVERCLIALICFIMKIFLAKLLQTFNIYTGGKDKKILPLHYDEEKDNLAALHYIFCYRD